MGKHSKTLTFLWWTCGYGHNFKFGNEAWHHESNQGYLPDRPGMPIPMYCTVDDCMDSTSLIWED